MGKVHPVVAYTRGVMDGSIPACELTRQAVQRYLDDLEHGAERGLHFDRAAAEHAVQFFGFLRHHKGEWAGRVFVLSPWQYFIVWNLFGWKRADGYRRFRTAYISVARKNGKTELMAGLALYLLVADGEPGAEVYTAATKRDQAKLCLNAALKMRNQSPALRGMVKHIKTSDTLIVESTSSILTALGADSNTLDGLNVHGSIIDELHAHKRRDLVELLETATSARRQPLQLEITTAGYNQDTICGEHQDYSEQILSGSVQDDSWFSFITGIDEDDDWRDENSWEKANPNYGISVKADDLQRLADKAQHMPAAQNSFRRLHLNQWTQQSDRWIDLQIWDDNAGEPIDEAQYAGRPFYGGLDLSAVSDITAWVMVFPDEDIEQLLHIITRFWVPEAQLTNDSNRYRGQYQAWAQDGWLTVTPGNAIDYQFVKAQILEDVQRFQFVDMNVDRLFQGYQLSMELQDEGLDVFGMGQGFYSMAAPMKEFERRLLGKKLHHGGNPVLRWMANNMAVKQDPAGNLKPDKSESQGRIDGMVALVMALDRASRHEDTTSVYEERGLLIL